MATELPPTVVATPTNVTVVTPVIKRPIWGRVFDAVLLALGILVALADFLGGFDLTTLGLTQKQAAHIWFGTLVARFALGQMRPKLVDVKSEPAGPSNGGPH